MAAGQYNLVIEQGATFDQKFQWLDFQRIPIPLAGYTAKMQVRRKTSATSAEFTLTTENGGIEIDPVGNTIRVKLSAVATAAITWTEAFYDLLLTAPGGEPVTRLLQGSVFISPGVTR